MNRCLGIINLDESERRMEELVNNRPLASVPFGGRYRIIDFVLSNMTNSGIESIGVFTKNKSRSLMDHISNGKPWDLDRKIDGLRVFNFGDDIPFLNDVHNFYNNIDFLELSKYDYVLLSPSYMICNIDYAEALKDHIQSKNDITIIYKNVRNADSAFEDCDVVNLDENKKVVSMGRNIARSSVANISMEMYIMKKSLFIDMLEKCMLNGVYKKIKSFINNNVAALNVGTYEFKGYLACINSLNSYYNANMDLLKKKVAKELFNKDNPIYTKGKSEPPTKYGAESSVVNSMVANGCCIEGEVKNCILFRKVSIERGAKLEDCIILQKSSIGENTILKKVITDKGTEIKAEGYYSGSEFKPYVVNKLQNTVKEKEIIIK